MRKLIIICLCFMMWGCGVREQPPAIETDEPQVEYVDKIGWLGDYQNDEIHLRILHNDDYPDGFEFQIDIDGEGFGEYTRYITEDQKEAIFDTQEDGYTLHFILKDDKVIVKESGGLSYLNTELSGEYKRL